MQIDINVTHPRSIKFYDTLEKKYYEAHSNKYDYSKAVFINTRTKMTIICPEHGEFGQTPGSHLFHGCDRCSKEYTGKLNSKTNKEFINEASILHSNLYDYNKTRYILGDEKVIITCKIHGDFKQSLGFIYQVQVANNAI